MLQILLSATNSQCTPIITIRINNRVYKRTLIDVLECHKSNRRDTTKNNNVLTTIMHLV